MLTVSSNIKNFFFDRMKVIAAVDKDRLRFLRNAGGFARKTARNSMKKKGKARQPPKNPDSKAYQRWLDEIRNPPASPPGKPPFAHTDDPVVTLRNILFAYDMASGGVVVGPVGLRHKALRAAGGTIPPALHEFGGKRVTRQKLVSFTDDVIIDGEVGRDSKGKFTKAPRKIVKGRRWVPIGKGARPGQPTRRSSVTYPPRPYMKPAIDKTKNKFKDLWFTNPGSAG